MKTTVKSSWVADLVYNSKTREMYIRTKNDKVYIYDKVSPATYTKIVNAKSVGSALSEYMRGRDER